ncbi:hypothetical protein EHI_155390 [Entamoeba histolytica HM-1:IMSS]|uniref:Uncharacterized protein n=2 Tax=Entamoeba histolytica (strain ATCC 30459 / HM-1:IMSS / ABRM) TaxID=294381 RepID=B1N2S8_ENTH1|nr:hypothetical protein EHI_155390 [Entamoeba histolytica HM-1:IMSS]EDS89728.1 hypothetical protein EHI_155390 [Entamoeba histolytica HM-1:IMSS]ENY60350.1 hypothetical protein EHI7A_050350 [Entamoeba histolytica HM-1:IMSS-A]|eukprot:XP_001913494.1 hypothetical protein EHI_155390 [Entamoeba histolytica HM-1:IMSS]
MDFHRHNTPLFPSLTSVLTGIQQPNAPIWSADETILLEQQMATIDPSEDELRTVLMIAPWFPHKSIQQISLRMKWIRSRTNQSWDDFCKSNEKNPPKSCTGINMSETSPNECSSGWSSSYSSNQSSPKPPQESSFRKSFRTSKSEDYVRSQLQRGLSQPQSTFLAKSMYTPVSSKKEPQKREQENYDISTLLNNNEEILKHIEQNLKYGDEFAKYSKNDIIQFCVNLRLLLGLTDSTAKPNKLPFMPMILNISPDIITIPQETQNQIQQQNLSSHM